MPPRVSATKTRRRENAVRERPSPSELQQRFVAAGGNIHTLAAELGVGRNTLYRWFKEAGLDVAALRSQLE